MAIDPDALWTQAERSLQAQRVDEALCYLTELVGTAPTDRKARLMLALAVGHGGDPAGALTIMRAFAERLIHDGFLLPAIVVIHRGLANSGGDPQLIDALCRLHVRGIHAKAGTLDVPPPPARRRRARGADVVTAQQMQTLPMPKRLETAVRVGSHFPPAGAPAAPQPIPLFCELDTEVFVETIKLLRYYRVPAGASIIEEGAEGNSLIIVASGTVAISKEGHELCRLGQASVLGEMSLITHAPRSASAAAVDEVEYFELSRDEVADLAKQEPKVLQELVAYCRGRLLLNLLRTSPLFSQFDEATRNQLLAHFQTITIAKDEPAVLAGDRSRGLFVVASGEAEVSVTNDDGERVVVASLGPGQVFGEISLLRNTPATADVLARGGPLAAIVLPDADFREVLARYPQVHHYLESLTVERIEASREAAISAGFVDPDDIVVL